jgi:hypothetical protein
MYAHQHREFPLIHLTQQLLLQNILILLILLRALIRTIVLPAHHLATLATRNITHYMTAGRHVALACFSLLDIDDFVEEVGFAVLAAEILRARSAHMYPSWTEVREGGSAAYPTYDLVMVGQVRLAVLAAVDLLCVQVDVVGQALTTFSITAHLLEVCV